MEGLLKDAKAITHFLFVIILIVALYIFQNSMDQFTEQIKEVRISIVKLNESVSNLTNGMGVVVERNQTNRDDISDLKEEMNFMRQRVRDLEKTKLK